MKLEEEFFAIKLYELEQQWGRILSRLKLCLKEALINSQHPLSSKKTGRVNGSPSGFASYWKISAYSIASIIFSIRIP